MKKIAVIGASADHEKFGNKCVRAFLNQGYEVFPVNPKGGEIEGLKCYADINELSLAVKNIELASFYVPSQVGIKLIPDLLKIGVKKVYLNPGSASEEIVEKLKELNIEPLEMCSIVAVGETPADYP